MRFGGNMVSVALVGLTSTLVSTGLADGKKDAPRASAAAKHADDAANRAAKRQDSGRPGTRGKPATPAPAHAAGAKAVPAPEAVGMHGQRLTDLEAKELDGTLTDKERDKLEKFRQKQATHQTFHEARRARLAELHQKERSGKLSDHEKSELDKLAKVEERLDALSEQIIEQSELPVKEDFEGAAYAAINEDNLDSEVDALAHEILGDQK